MPLREIPTDDILNELKRRNPWLDRKQASPFVDLEPATLAARDSRKSHVLPRYKDGKNGRVKYQWLDIQEYIRQQLVPC